MSQISSSTEDPIHVGARVRIRRQPWRVTGIRQDERCAAITVAGLGSGNSGERRTFLTPFEAAEPIVTTRRIGFTTRATWRRRGLDLLTCACGADSLRTAESARIDLLPYQLEPALAVVRGLASRVLIADDVGLGKTIQAALVVAELVARGAASRVLVLTPAGLRDQWAAEFRDRFGLPLGILDLRTIRQERAQWPIGVNPWTLHPMVAASLDYVKRPEVLPAVRGQPWDVVIVDEAHHVTAGTDRLEAVSALCADAACVLLLTATPHSGDAAAFDALCALGRRADELIVFRRTRTELGIDRARRIHRVPVGLTNAERQMHARLAAFIRAVRAEHTSADTAIALAVLRKRACSSAAALARSVQRRLAAVTEVEAVDPARQLLLPLHDDGELDGDDEAPQWTIPALHDRGQEQRMLVRLAEAAEAASLGETKLAVLTRLLRRLREPAIVFTEYRDTLLHLQRLVAPGAAMIHGGMSRAERMAALRAFETARVLLTTDAAGEGLNLHQRCRVVISLELPWNPMRLEQRLGRVDRIGQERRVHGFHLIARGAGEHRVLCHLTARAAAARDAIGGANPLGGRSGPQAPSASTVPRLRLIAEAAAESHRVRRVRALAPPSAHRHLPADDVAIVRASNWRTRRQLAGRALIVGRIDALDGAGQVVATRLTGCWLPAAAAGCRWTIDAADRAVAVLDVGATVQWTEAVFGAHAAFWAARLGRERAIVEAVTATPRQLIQSGLFDQRATRAHDHTAGEHATRLEQHAQRLELVRGREALSFTRPRPVLVLLP